MYAQTEKTKEHKNKAVCNSVAQKKSNVKQSFGFVDNRPETVAQRKLQKIANNYSINQQHAIQLVATRKRDSLSRGDLSRKARHTAGAMKHGKKRWSFQSGNEDGMHAEDIAVDVIKEEIKKLPPGDGTKNKIFTIYITKSPCYQGDKKNNATFTAKKGAKKQRSCTTTLVRTHNSVINGYRIKLIVKIWRMYHGIGVQRALASSKTSIIKIREKGIEVSGIDSDDDILSQISDTDSAKDWRKNQRSNIENPKKLKKKK